MPGARNAVETCLGVRPGEHVALIADEAAWTWVEMPLRREAGRADLGASVGVAAYGPDVS